MDTSPPCVCGLVRSALLVGPEAMLCKPSIPTDAPKPVLSGPIRQHVGVVAGAVKANLCITLLMIRRGWIGDKSVDFLAPL